MAIVENKKPKAVFTFVEAGMGHIIPMEGMYQTFQKKYGDKVEVVKSYIFEESKSEKVKKMGGELSAHTKRAANNWLYNKLEAFSYALPSKFILKMLDAHFGSAKQDFSNDLKELNADLIVSSYYLPSHLSANDRKKGKINPLIVTYAPDPYIYPAWDRDCDLFLVNNDKAYEMATKSKFKGKVKQIPFIYREDFYSLTLTKSEAREKLSLKDKFTVVFSCGAYGTSKTEKLATLLASAGLDINLIIICGKNDELFTLANTLAKNPVGKTEVIPVGFTDQMSLYMRSADVLVGKAGSNTVMETAYMGVPLIVATKSSQLEVETTKYLVKNKIGLDISNPKKLIKEIEERIAHPEKAEEHKKNVEKFCDTTGAQKAADEIFELLKTRYPEL